MRNIIVAAALAAALPAAGQAASLGLTTNAFPVVIDTVNVLWFADFNEFNILGTGDGEASDESGPLFDGLFLQIVGEVGPGGAVGGSGGELVIGFAGNSASVALSDFGYVIGLGIDTLEFLFLHTSGDRLLATITGEFGEDPLSPFFDGIDDDFSLAGATLRIQDVVAPAPIPLPAGGVLLLTALGALALRRRG